MKKIQVSAINYTNTKPFLYGLQNLNSIEIVLDYPAKIAEKLLNNDAQIGIVPLVEYLRHKHSLKIISPYGIACNGEVKSVALLSQLPLQEIKTITLDYQSRTSVELCKILCENFWKIKPQFLPLHNDLDLLENEAVVLIGDRVFEIEKKYSYKYDLGLAWKNYTGLPFVFAVWVSNQSLSPIFIEAFNSVLALGLNNLNEVFKTFNINNLALKAYLQHDIQFCLSDEYYSAMQLFEIELNKINLVQQS